MEQAVRRAERERLAQEKRAERERLLEAKRRVKKAAARKRRAANRGGGDVIFAHDVTSDEEDECDEEMAQLIALGAAPESWRFGNASAADSEGSNANNANSNDDDDDDGESGVSGTSGDDAMADAENPIPDHVDPITFEKVVRPAISPSGHVMGYDNWLRCLQSGGNVCPFTKQPLQKRNLVILTHANIEEYRDKIVTI